MTPSPAPHGGVLFLLAAPLGAVRRRALLAYADDLPEISALDNYRPNTITRLSSAQRRASSASSPPSAAWSCAIEDIAPVLRQAILATEDGDFEQHFGLEHVAHPHHGRQGRRHGPAGRRQHHHAATGAQPVPAAGRYMRGGVYERSHRSQDQGGDPGRSAREALHEAGDLRLLRQPGAAARRLRRGGRRAALLQQVGARPHGGRGRHAGRDHPGAGAAQPIRQPDTHPGPAQQLRAATHGRRGLHHAAAGPGGDERPGHERGQRAERASRRPTSSSTSARSWRIASAPPPSTRPGCRWRRRSTRGGSATPSARSIAGCDGSTSGAVATGGRRATSAPAAR